MNDRLKQIARLLALITIVTAPYWLSNLLWHVQAQPQRQVIVVDYSTLTDDYAGHAGIIWTLNHARVPSPNPAHPWRAETDFVGYYAENRDNPARLAHVNIGSADWMYIANAYGVYQNDIDILEGREIQPQHSELLFGALSPQDVDVVKNFVASGHDIAVEFAGLIPPTAENERTAMEALLGVEWNGWTGRVFPDLRDLTDVPMWFEEKLNARYPTGELPVDPCLALFGPAEELVLVCDPDYATIAPRISFTDAGREVLGNLRSDAAQFGWFVLGEPHPDTTVLAEIRLPDVLVRSAEFHASELELQHPALTQRIVGPSTRTTIYVDAGRISFDPGRHNLAGLTKAQALLNRRRDLLSPRPVFWQFYVPAMRAILRN